MSVLYVVRLLNYLLCHWSHSNIQHSHYLPGPCQEATCITRIMKAIRQAYKVVLSISSNKVLIITNWCECIQCNGIHPPPFSHFFPSIKPLFTHIFQAKPNPIASNAVKNQKLLLHQKSTWCPWKWWKDVQWRKYLISWHWRLESTKLRMRKIVHLN